MIRVERGERAAVRLVGSPALSVLLTQTSALSVVLLSPRRLLLVLVFGERETEGIAGNVLLMQSIANNKHSLRQEKGEKIHTVAAAAAVAVTLMVAHYCPH